MQVLFYYNQHTHLRQYRVNAFLLFNKYYQVINTVKELIIYCWNHVIVKLYFIIYEYIYYIYENNWICYQNHVCYLSLLFLCKVWFGIHYGIWYWIFTSSALSIRWLCTYTSWKMSFTSIFKIIMYNNDVGFMQIIVMFIYKK